MDTIIEQQVAMDEALIPHAQRLRIAIVHHYAIRFKMDNKKHIVNLESFRDILHICPRVHGQTFAELPFEEEILAFIPMEIFVAIINKCLTGKSSGYDSLRLSQAQIQWGLYHKRNVDYHYMMWEDFVYQVEHKNQKKSNEMDDFMFSTIKLVSKHQNTQQFSAMLPIELANEEIRNSNAYKEYYAIATGVAPPKPKASVWKTRSSSDTSITPTSVVAGPRLTASTKGNQPAKASKAKSLSALSEVAMIEAQQLKLTNKRILQQTHISQASGSGADEGTGFIPGVPDVPTDESERELSCNSTNDEGNGDDEDDDGEKVNDDDDDDEVVEKDDEEKGGDDEHENDEDESDEETRDERSFDPIPKTPESSDDSGNGKEDLGLNVGREEGHIEEEEEDELYRDVNINQGRVSSQFVTSMLNPTLDAIMESIFKTASTSVAPLPISAPTLTTSAIATTTTRQTNPFAEDVSAILGVVHRYMDQQMNEAVKVAVQIQSDRLRDATQRENDEFLRTIDENIKKIIKEQVKEHVQVQVSKILPRIEQTVNEQLEAKVLTRPSYSSRTSYVVAADLSKIELKKILIEKIESNKSIQRSDEQRNLYRALVEAFESNKIILDTYGENVTLKRRRDDDTDKDEDRGSKRHREGKEPESTSALIETATRSAGRSTHGSRSRQASVSESFIAEEPMQTTFQMDEPTHPDFDTGADDQPIVQSFQHPEWFPQQQKPPTLDRDGNKTLPATHGSFQPWISELAKRSESRSSFDELMDTPLDFSNYLMNRLGVDTLTPELLACPTYELMKGSCKSLRYPHNLLKPLPLIPNNRGRRVIPFEHFINNDLEYLRGGASSRKYTTSVTKTKAANYGHIKWIEDLVPRTMWIQEPIDYDKHALWERRLITVTELKIVEWHNYKHLDWITVRIDDDKLYKFKEGDFKRLRIQDIEDMLLLLVQGKLTNLTRRMEDLQLGVKSYPEKFNLTRPDSYRTDLKRKEAYSAYSNPRGFIYQNKDKRNRLMRINELHKFSDKTLTDIRTALDDHLKGIRMQYMPTSI
nr:hypothetical protein [Tanacetum cinerariifolium]